MSRNLKAIERKINETIADLCGYMQEEKTFIKDVRCIYIPIINNLEEALSELQEINCLHTLNHIEEENDD